MSICVPQNYWDGGVGPNVVYEPVNGRCYYKTGETCNTSCESTVFPVEMTDCNDCADIATWEPPVDHPVGGNSAEPAQHLRFKITAPRLKTFMFLGRSFTVYAPVPTHADARTGTNAINLGASRVQITPHDDSTPPATCWAGFDFQPNRLENGTIPTGITPGVDVNGAVGDFITNAGTTAPKVDRFATGTAPHHAGGAYVLYTDTIQTPRGIKWSLGDYYSPWKIISQPHLGGGIDTWIWSHFWNLAGTPFGGSVGQSQYLRDGTTDPGYIDIIERIRTTGPGSVFLKNHWTTYGATDLTNGSGTFNWTIETPGESGLRNTYDLDTLRGQTAYNDLDSFNSPPAGGSGVGTPVRTDPSGIAYSQGKDNHDIHRHYNLPIEISLSRPMLGVAMDGEGGQPSDVLRPTHPGTPNAFTYAWPDAPNNPLGTFAPATLANMQPDMDTMSTLPWGRAMGIGFAVEIADVNPLLASENTFISGVTFGQDGQ